MRLTRAQRRVLRDMAAGGCFFAALREPGDFLNDGIVFSELVGIVVHRPGSVPEERYRVRNKTVGPLYLATPALVNCFDGDSGFRCFDITDAGRAALVCVSSNPPVSASDGSTRQVEPCNGLPPNSSNAALKETP